MVMYDSLINRVSFPRDAYYYKIGGARLGGEGGASVLAAELWIVRGKERL